MFEKNILAGLESINRTAEETVLLFTEEMFDNWIQKFIVKHNELRIDAAGKTTVKRTEASAAASVQLN
jgi:hypothetical protein